MSVEHGNFFKTKYNAVYIDDKHPGRIKAAYVGTENVKRLPNKICEAAPAATNTNDGT